MQKCEKDYAGLVRNIMETGEERETRNGLVQGNFGSVLKLENVADDFPIIQGRKMFTRGILGELAAIVRGPKSVEDFTKWGCNYWGLWADDDGALRVDYGNAWLGQQVTDLKEALRNNPQDRRMILTSWIPENLSKLSLPCCHHTYQFYVSEGNTLHMTWSQRSVDMMIGLPSDMVLAATLLMTIANEFGFTPGDVTMFLGDCHVYAEHFPEAKEYCGIVLDEENQLLKPKVSLNSPEGKDFLLFEPEDLRIQCYEHFAKMSLKLKS